jgi:hypothetical protein
VDGLAVVHHDLAVLVALVEDTLEDGVKVGGVLGVGVGWVFDYVDYFGECFLIEHGVF